MKVLLLVALVALAQCDDTKEQSKRSVLHYGAWQPAVVSSYTTARELPSYVIPESTIVSRRVYTAPLTYPAYHSHPTYHTYGYATPIRSSYSYNYAPAWNYAGYSHSW